MNEIKNLKHIRSFVDKLMNEPRVESTGAKVVYVDFDLYNVDDSTDDPKKIPDHEGDSWKELLKAYGIDDDCYVTNTPAPADSSHPDFSVGGHMTPNEDGIVADGGSCYLMPLCYWHNNKGRDGVKFTHTQKKMLQLTGYNTGELCATFQLRLPSEDPYAVLYYHENQWRFKNISENQAHSLNESVLNPISPNQSISHYVLIQRIKGVMTKYEVQISELP